MELIKIWYMTDSKEGAKIARSIGDLGLSVRLVSRRGFKKEEILPSAINIFVLDLINAPLPAILAIARDDPRLQGSLKFIILKKRQIRQAVGISANLLHIEFISRPINRREFILLLEKSIIVERYHEIMRFISREAEERIEAFESLLTINRRDFFETEKEKEAFEKILNYEKHLMEEQSRLNAAIRDFTYMRQKELFDMKDRIKAEEMLGELRRKELMDANEVIRAQEALIDFSSSRLHDAHEIISASERAAELGRIEAIKLHEELKAARERNKQMADEIVALKGELQALRGAH